MNINPWLAEKINEYRRDFDAVMIRLLYEDSVKNDGCDLSWEQYVAVQALDFAFKEDKFLMTLRRNMDLPPEIINALYYCHVDCVADLLQLSKEELEVCAGRYSFEMAPIRKYLRKHGYKLHSCGERTYKIQSRHQYPALWNKEYRTWMLPSPGGTMDFDLDRPLAEKWWIDIFYSRYVYVQGEELLSSDWKGLIPPLDKGVPLCYHEFFTAARTFYKTYKSICAAENIAEPLALWEDLPENCKDIAGFSNDFLLQMKRTYVTALIDLFERTTLLRHMTPAKFLSGSDEDKLNLLDKEEADKDIILLLITYVELQIVFNIIMTDFREFAGRPVLPVPDAAKPGPVSASVEKAIMELRRRHTVEELRAKYIKCLEDSPGIRWEEFLIRCTLAES